MNESNSNRIRAKFLAEAGEHEMQILRDEGVYRHIRFQHPSHAFNWFEVITWPQHLCISGDMGTYVFARTKDMFTFFTGRTDDSLAINPDYWSQKLLSSDRQNSHKVFDRTVFERQVLDVFDESCEDKEILGTDKQALWRKVQEDILSCDDNEYAATDALYRFKDEYLIFDDYFEWFDPYGYNVHYLWCLYAIVWGDLGVSQQASGKFARSGVTIQQEAVMENSIRPMTTEHPETRKGEIYLGNFLIAEACDPGWQTARRGDLAYSIDGKNIPKKGNYLYPYFVQISEMEQSGFVFQDGIMRELKAGENVIVIKSAEFGAVLDRYDEDYEMDWYAEVVPVRSGLTCYITESIRRVGRPLVLEVDDGKEERRQVTVGALGAVFNERLVMYSDKITPEWFHSSFRLDRIRRVVE